LFERFRGWLLPGERLLMSLGGSAWEGTSEMLGGSFFYSGSEPGESLRLVRMAGFEILMSEIDDASSRAHLVIMAAARPG
jgi:hypothetical protein